MATEFNTQVSNGEYRLQFETDNKEHYLLMQSTARRCVFPAQQPGKVDCTAFHELHYHSRCHFILGLLPPIEPKESLYIVKNPLSAFESVQRTKCAPWRQSATGRLLV